MAATTEAVQGPEQKGYSKFIGTKLVNAMPMSAMEAGSARGYNTNGYTGDWPGYEVQYEDGYCSWSPKQVFDAAYRPTNGMPFGLAIEAMKKGFKVCRTGWNGKGMWLTLIHFASWHVNPEVNGTGAHSLNALPWIGMKTVDDGFVPWFASQTDMLADDWMIVE